MIEAEHKHLVGRRVRHDETGKEGIVSIEPRNTATHVYVVFDGADFAIPCHPDSLEFVEIAA